jgi:hypothetical protein
MKAVIMILWALGLVVLGVVLAVTIMLYPDITTWDNSNLLCLMVTALWGCGGLWFGARS